MTDNTDDAQKKVHLIKQPKPASAETPVQPSAKPEKPDEESGAERRKVVVVKKKVVLKKAAAKVVAHHDAEPGEAEAESQELSPSQPVQAQAKPVEAVSAVETSKVGVSESALQAPKEKAEKQQEQKGNAVAHAEQNRPQGSATSVPQAASGTSAQGQEDHKAPTSAHAPSAPRAGAAPSSGRQENGLPQRPRSTGPVGIVSGRPADRSGYRSQENQGRYYSDQSQGRTGSYQRGSSSSSGSSAGAGSGYQSGYQGRGYQSNRSGYQGSRPYSGSQGGYQGQQGPGRGPAGYGGQQGQGAGGYPRGPRPQGGAPGSAGRPGGYPYSQNRFGNRPNAGSPGRGPAGSRGNAPGPSPMESSKTAQRKPATKRKTTFARHEDELELEKELQLKKKAESRAIAIPKSIDIMENISVSDLAKKMNIKPAELISKLMSLGVMATINQKIDAETATILAGEYGCEVRIVSLFDETVIEKASEDPAAMKPRPPIVTVMGHVDHGKTKLLDAIRKTDVVSHEYGGITQHIGAYQVETPHGKITFLDTPGHAAFTQMRARGSQVTDIVVLVVSAVEGVMPQTKEAIDHARAAGVPIIVAVNKIDLPDANVDRVKTQLSEIGLQPEEWGGTTQFCEVSALQKIGINELLDAILLQAEVLELKASYDRLAEGKVIESKIDQGRGIVATIIVLNGTLHIGDPFVAGIFPGKVRAMFNDKGARVEIAEPSMPVEVLGFEGIPNAGDPFEVVEDEKYAREVSAKRQELKKYEEGKNVKKVTLDNLYETISAGEVQELKVVIKGDVQGSVEALKSMLEKLSTPEIRLNVIRAAAGAISEDDVMMASASDAIIIGFNVRPTPSAKALAEREKVDIRKYNIIYRAQEDIKKAMEGMLSPELKEQEIGKAEVREIFRVPKVGIVAGCYMLEGVVRRNSQVRVVRDNIEIFQGNINSLKRFKDDVKEVTAGFECGIGIENCSDLNVGDILEIYETIEVARTLSQATGTQTKTDENKVGGGKQEDAKGAGSAGSTSNKQAESSGSEKA